MMVRKRKLTKTEKRDLRDNASLILSGISTAVGVIALAIALNEKPSEDDHPNYDLRDPIRR